MNTGARSQFMLLIIAAYRLNHEKVCSATSVLILSNTKQIKKEHRGTRYIKMYQIKALSERFFTSVIVWVHVLATESTHMVLEVHTVHTDKCARQ
jgi:hypothetical protein